MLNSCAKFPYVSSNHNKCNERLSQQMNQNRRSVLENLLLEIIFRPRFQIFPPNFGMTDFRRNKHPIWQKMTSWRRFAPSESFSIVTVKQHFKTVQFITTKTSMRLLVGFSTHRFLVPLFVIFLFCSVRWTRFATRHSLSVC